MSKQMHLICMSCKFMNPAFNTSKIVKQEELDVEKSTSESIKFIVC